MCFAAPQHCLDHCLPCDSVLCSRLVSSSYLSDMQTWLADVLQHLLHTFQILTIKVRSADQCFASGWADIAAIFAYNRLLMVETNRLSCSPHSSILARALHVCLQQETDETWTSSFGPSPALIMMPGRHSQAQNLHDCLKYFLHTSCRLWGQLRSLKLLEFT